MNFDDIVQSMVSLFVLATLEGWPTYMQSNIDGAPAETGPIADNNPFVRYLFVAYIMIGSIFCINLFVAIVSMNFNISQEKNKSLHLNSDQDKWIQIVLLVSSNT